MVQSKESSLIWGLTILVLAINSVNSSNPSLTAVIDNFKVLNGQYVSSVSTDDNGQQWNPKADLTKLNLLSNDLELNLPLDSCVEERKFRSVAMNVNNSAKPWFKEVHKDAGINHVHRANMSVRPFCMLDSIMTNGNSSTVLRGEFCVPEQLTGGAAVGDYNRDGWEDIYFTVFDGPSKLYKNNGDGTFSDVSQETGIGPGLYASGAGWVDVDSDGDLDLYVTTVAGTRHHLYINYGGHFQEEGIQRNCAMQFANRRKLAGMTPNFGDFNNDGFMDIYVSEWILHSVGKPTASRLLRNRGVNQPGYFDDVTDSFGVNMDGYRGGGPMNMGTHTFGSSFTDFNEDGWPELLVTADYGDSKVFWNQQGMNFSECTKMCGIKGDQDAIGHAIGDYDNDGHMDWFSTAIYHNGTACSMSGCVYGRGGNRLYRYRGNKQFENITDRAGVRGGGWGWGAAFFDFNNDGYLDIVTTNGSVLHSMMTNDMMMQKKQMILWQNLGLGYNGTTREVAGMLGLNGTGRGRGLLKFDYDDDGDEDIVVCNNLGAPEIYKNRGGNNNTWIKVRVVHKCMKVQTRQCESYGARVQVISAANHTQTQEIGSSTHYMGQSERIAHFGLGRGSGNVTVRVRWPAVNREITFTDVQPNTTLRAVQPPSEAQANQTVSFNGLNICPSIKLTGIMNEPTEATVGINADGKTASFQLKPGVNFRGLQSLSFTYRASLVVASTIVANSTAMVYVNYTYCVNGRKMAPASVATDERRFDGISNNKIHIHWGAIEEDLARDWPPAYGDGTASPAGECTLKQKLDNVCRFPDERNGLGSNRPSPRNISNVLCNQVEQILSSRWINEMLTFWGQFLAHDTDHTGTQKYDVLHVSVPPGDVHFDLQSTGHEHLSFTRSIFNRCTGRSFNTPRQQPNKISAYIDGSVVYGTRERCDQLRTKQQGKMKLRPGGFLPFNTMGLANANNIGREPSRLLAAGDVRVNEQPGLIAFHTLFVREHNRLCDQYILTHPQAGDEEIFQYARRILIAELQAITFREYLPDLLGGMKHIPAYQGYKDDIDVAMTTTMSTAAFRFGHSQASTHVFRLNGDGSTPGHIALRDAYFVPEIVEKEGGIDPILRGAVAFATQEMDTKMVDDLRNVLFPVGPRKALDLAALNIQRGRDHGLPDYNTVRKGLGFPGLTSFDDLTDDKKVSRDMEALYGHVDNIDLWVGGLAEKHEPGSELGPVFRAIITRNFLKIRDGDRFWYERYLNKEEIEMVHGLTFAQIIRLNTGFKTAPDAIFFSTNHCSGARDYQCVPKEKPGKAEEQNLGVIIGLSVVCAIFAIVVICLIALLLYKRMPINRVTPKEAWGNEKKSTASPIHHHGYSNAGMPTVG